MKSILLGSLFLSLSASACPKIEGQYYCLFQYGSREPELDVFTVKQWVSNEPAEADITWYNTSYRSIGGAGDTFGANSSGMADDFGWVTKCTKDKIISVTHDFSQMAEMYLNSEGHLIRTYQQNVIQNCAPKKQ